MKKINKSFFDGKLEPQKLKASMRTVERKYGVKKFLASGLFEMNKRQGLRFAWLKFFISQEDFLNGINLQGFLCTTDGTVLLEQTGESYASDIIHFVEIANGSAEERIRGLAKELNGEEKDSFIEAKLDEYEIGYNRIKEMLIEEIASQPEKINHIPPFFFNFDVNFTKRLVPTYELKALDEIKNPDSEEGRKQIKKIRNIIVLMKRHIEKMRKLHDAANEAHSSAIEESEKE